MSRNIIDTRYSISPNWYPTPNLTSEVKLFWRVFYFLFYLMVTWEVMIETKKKAEGEKLRKQCAKRIQYCIRKANLKFIPRVILYFRVFVYFMICHPSLSIWHSPSMQHRSSMWAASKQKCPRAEGGEREFSLFQTPTQMLTISIT